MRKELRKIKVLYRRFLISLRLNKSPLTDIREYRSILIVSPHPDDEIIGIGGYLMKTIEDGGRICIVYLTDGEKSLENVLPSVVASQRLALTQSVLSRLGLTESQARWMHLPDGSIPRSGKDGFDSVVDKMQAILRETLPDAVFVTHPSDTWPYDHVAAFEIVESALLKSGISSALYGYWVWLWYSIPLDRIAGMNWKEIFRIPINDVISGKRELMDMYLKPASEDGRPWSGVLPAAMLKPFGLPYEVVQRFR